MRRLDRWVGVLPFAGTLAAWWLVSHLPGVVSATLPTPERVFDALRQLVSLGDLQDDILVSMGRIGLAAAISIVLGIGLGVAAGLSRTLADLLSPLATFFNAVSGIAWIPLAITWFGLGTAAVTFIIVNSVFFLVFFNTLLGVRSVPKRMEQAVRTLGGGNWEVVTSVLLPGALPHIMTGIRTGLAFGWRALIAGELIAATSGLGYLIFDASRFLRTDEVMGGIVVIGVLWILIDGIILSPLERRTIQRWGMVTAP